MFASDIFSILERHALPTPIPLDPMMFVALHPVILGKN